MFTTCTMTIQNYYSFGHGCNNLTKISSGV